MPVLQEETIFIIYVKKKQFLLYMQLRASKHVKQVLMNANKGLSSIQEQRALSRTPL